MIEHLKLVFFWIPKYWLCSNLRILTRINNILRLRGNNLCFLWSCFLWILMSVLLMLLRITCLTLKLDFCAKHVNRYLFLVSCLNFGFIFAVNNIVVNHTILFLKLLTLFFLLRAETIMTWGLPLTPILLSFLLFEMSNIKRSETPIINLLVERWSLLNQSLILIRQLLSFLSNLV